MGKWWILEIFPQITFKQQQKYFMWKSILFYNRRCIIFHAIYWRKCYIKWWISNPTLRLRRCEFMHFKTIESAIGVQGLTFRMLCMSLICVWREILTVEVLCIQAFPKMWTIFPPEMVYLFYILYANCIHLDATILMFKIFSFLRTAIKQCIPTYLIIKLMICKFATLEIKNYYGIIKVA
jgi:hypothetical protein